MVQTGLSKLKQNQKFILTGKNNVLVQFGKYRNLSFKDISQEDPIYLDYLIENWSGQMTAEVQRRLRYWQQQTNGFFL